MRRAAEEFKRPGPGTTANACGRPVIAYAGGGSLYTSAPGVTGELFGGDERMLELLVDIGDADPFLDKELRRVAEPLITLSKTPTLANRRLAFDRLRDRDVVTKLFNELGPRYQARPGGYLRILKFGFRQGDAAPMALVELVDRPEPTDEVEVNC